MLSEPNSAVTGRDYKPWETQIIINTAPRKTGKITMISPNAADLIPSYDLPSKNPNKISRVLDPRNAMLNQTYNFIRPDRSKIPNLA
jgi:hypothetical protein